MFEFLEASKNVLGINERNLVYLRRYNKKRGRKIADDKLLTKKILKKAGILTPEVYGIIRNDKELMNFDWNKLPNSFVIKPKCGTGGAGIIVIFGKSKKTGNWVKADGSQLSVNQLQLHITNILDGTFSLKNKSDFAIIEERVRMHPVFKRYSFRGIPDVRILVFNKVPIMAELRLPTRISGGTANLHAGGVGVGIDMCTGVTTNAILYDNIIDRHPDTNLPLSGIKIPFWTQMLRLAVKAQSYIPLGYMGIDIVVDREKGPMVLEVNARPGLAIQIANLEGLKGRLKRVAGIKVKNIERGIRLAKDLFGGEVEEEIEEISGRQVISTVEYVRFYKIDGTKGPLCKVKIDTGAYLSSIGKDLAFELGYKDAYDYFYSLGFKTVFDDLEEARRVMNEYRKKVARHPDLLGIALAKSSVGVGRELRPLILLNFELSGVKVKSMCTIADRTGLMYRAIIGRSDLKDFLIDPLKKTRKIF